MSSTTPAPGAPVALITGASSGIGRATVERFRRAGWRVAATMRRPEASDLAASADLRLIALDVTDEASVATAVAATVEAFGRLDVVVNNAGYSLSGAVEAMTPEQLRRQFDTNVLGLAAVTRHALPHLRASRGTVVNISSIGGRLAFPFGAAYHGTKWAVEGMSDALRFELAPHGVRVRVVEPGAIRTDFYDRSMAWAEHPAYQPHQSAMRELSDRAGAGAPGPEPVAETIFRAATSRGGRLRWPVRTGPFLLLHRLLPDALWRRALTATLEREVRRRAAGAGSAAAPSVDTAASVDTPGRASG
jgi:NAD(P)-dependent dehydrogenase (short-subunit alcohol dehydrogenase family)